ncbi:MAG: ATP F0F1 synthase subunit B [Anaerolineaceae bacterium]|nr:ATP F0F1 synthase subunit B [Anaerolineaceae bacterium]MCB9100238.1 ATP F0F1 synthase subunit B [Anaerolineales bacterium]
MHLDGFTFVIQIINFLVLVALLKHFFYARVIEAMNKREALITTRLQETEQQRQTARQEAESYRQQRQALADQREAMLAQTRKEVEAERKTLLAMARTEVDDIRAGWQASVRREQELFFEDLHRRAGHLACEAARHTLHDLANANLEQQTLDIFIERLRSLNGGERQKLLASLDGPESEVTIRTAFDIAPNRRDPLTAAVRGQLGRQLEVQFETAPELGFGVELETPGRKLAWSLEQYLGSLEEALAEAIKDVGVETRAGEPS